MPRPKRKLTALALALAATLAAPVVVAQEDGARSQQTGRSQSDLIRDMERLKREYRELRGDVERLQREVKRLRERERSHYMDLDNRLQRLRQQGAETGADSGAASSAGGEADAASGAQPEREAAELYQAAFDELDQGRYEAAREGLQQVVEAYPESEYASNAVYWIAETHYAERSFEAAAEQFQRLLETYPDSNKVADAQLKLGYVAFEQDRLQLAKERLEKVRTAYPESTAANLAEQRLAQIRQLRPDEAAEGTGTPEGGGQGSADRAEGQAEGGGG